jgi:Protein of unknown function (DUF1273).
MGKTCCLISPLAAHSQHSFTTRLHLKKEILSAVDEGFTIFLSSFEHGAETIFASVIAELKSSGHEIQLVAAISSRASIHKADIDLLNLCDDIHICSRDTNIETTTIRDQYMIDISDLVLFIDHENTIESTSPIFRYAQAKEKNIRIIDIAI